MRFLSVLALPLVAAMPSYSEGALQRARSALSAGLEVERRGAMMSNAAMAQFEFAPYEITYLAVQCRKGGKEAPKTGLYNCTLSFDWFDPNSVRQNNVSSTACSSSWLWDGVTSEQGENNTYSTDAKLCGHQGFTMWFASFENGTDFAVELAHQYKDSENFTAPYDHPTTFSQLDAHLQKVAGSGSGESVRYAAPGTTYCNITGLSD